MGLACFGLLWLAVGLGLLSLAVRLGLLWLGLLGFTSEFRVGGLLAWLQFRVGVGQWLWSLPCGYVSGLPPVFRCPELVASSLRGYKS